MYIYIYIYIHTHIYIETFIYTYIYIYIYIYICEVVIAHIPLTLCFSPHPSQCTLSCSRSSKLPLVSARSCCKFFHGQMCPYLVVNKRMSLIFSFLLLQNCST